MKKRSVFVLLLGVLWIMLINFVSAQFGYGGYGFSLSNFLYSINSSTLILVVLFIIFFAILHGLVFTKFFRGNMALSSIVSFCVSILAVWGINRMQWNMGGFFYGLGISEDALYTILMIVLLLTAIYLVIKKKLRYLFLGLGILLIALALFTEIFYEYGTALTIGIIILVIGLFMAWWNSKRQKEKGYYGGRGYGLKDLGGRAWRGTKAVGRGAQEAGQYTRERYKRGREYIDPRSRLERIKKRQKTREERRSARRQIRTLKRKTSKY